MACGGKAQGSRHHRHRPRDGRLPMGHCATRAARAGCL